MTPPDLKIRVSLEGAEAVKAGADRAADSVARLGNSAQQGGQQVQLSGQQMAQVSNQLQDLFIQIQGGQAPLTAFLQQGSQLSAVFGGAGNALRAVASVFSPVVVGIGSVVAAVASVGLAYNAGANEAQAYTRALVLTGNAAGVTVGQLQAMALAQSQVVGTQGAAAEALAALAATGQVSAASLGSAADAAIRLARVGIPLEETAKKFASLGKEPLSALIKLNETENFLTVSVYKQVKALTEQGRAAEAAAVAQDAYAATGKERAQQLEASLGSLEKGWKKLGDVAKGAWDFMLNIGREETAEDKLKAVEAKILAAQQKLDTARLSARGGKRVLTIQTEQAEIIAGLNSEREAYQEIIRLAAKSANQQAERDAALKAATKADEAATKAAKASGAEREREAALLERLNGLSGTFARDLKDLQDVRQRGVITERQYVDLVTELIQKQPAAAAAAKQLADQYGQVADAEARGMEIRERYLDSLGKSADAAVKQVQALRDEAAASAIAQAQHISLKQAIDQVVIARLEDQAAQAAKAGDTAAVTALNREIAARRELLGLLGGQDARKAAEDASKELDKFLDPAKADSFGAALTKAFEGAGNGLAKMSNALQLFGQEQEKLALQQARAKTETDPAKKLRAQLKINEDAQKSQIGLYASMTGAAKGFFKEGSQGYKTLEAAETAFRAYQLASDLVKGTSAAAVAVASQGQGDPHTAFPRMAAMAAAMAALGFAVSGGFAKGGSSGGDGAKQATGTGTVLGDASAKSESLSKATERLADTARLQLTTQSGMLAALRNIENSIGNITNLVLRSGATAGDAASRFGVQTGYAGGASTRATLGGAALGGAYGAATGAGLAFLGAGTAGLIGAAAGGVAGLAVVAIDKLLFGGRITAALFGTKTKITGNGLFAGAQDLGSIAANGLSLQDYADVNTTKRFLGIKTSNRNSTQYQAADPVLQQQFGLVFKNFYDAVKLAAGPLDQALDGVTARLDGFVVNIGKIDLQGLSGTQIQEKLSAVLGAAGDQIAAAAIPGLDAFQQVGEGYFDTLIRVSSGVETAKAQLDLLGISTVSFNDIARKQGDVAAELVRQSIAGFESLDGTLSSVGALLNTLDGSAADLVETYRSLTDVRDILLSVGESGDTLTAAMIRGAGGLDNLKSGLSSYLENFFSEAEQSASGKARLSEQFGRLGLGSLPATREAFRALVDAQETTTDSGQKAYAQLINLSGAFADLVPATATLADTAAEAATKMIEAGQRVFADLAKSQAQAEITLLKAQGDTAGAAARTRALALADLTAGLSAADAITATASYDYVQSLLAQASALDTAATAAKQAAEAEAQRTKAIASERDGLEQRLLEAQGDTAALRARELAGLDASNRALQERLNALTDEQAATQAAAQAAEQQAQRARDIASERDGLVGRLLELQGDTAAIRARELAALDGSNRALLERIYALSDEQAASQAATEASKQAADAEAQRLQNVASERDGLVGRLLELQGDTAAIRARELAALDGSNRALLERIYALTDEQAASQAATEAAKQAADAEAQRLQNVASERDGLVGRLLELQGDTAAIRARELAALDGSNRALQEQINALIDQQAAAQSAAQALDNLKGQLASLASTRFDLQGQLLTLQGNGAEAARLKRERDLASLGAGLTPEQLAQVTAAYDANTALQAQIDATQAAQQAAEELAAAQIRAAEDARAAAEQFRDAWQSVTDTLLSEAARIRALLGGGAGGETLAGLQSKFAIATAQARAGDQDAAKLLPELSKALLEKAGGSASSLIELQRTQAQTAASLERTAATLAGNYGLFVPTASPAASITGAGFSPGPQLYAPSSASANSANTDLAIEVAALRAEVAALRASAERTEMHAKRTKEILSSVTEDGRAMQTEDF